MGQNHQLTLPAEPESLTAIQNFIEQTCAEANFGDETSYDIKLAVDEVCANIIQHGYAGMVPASISVSLQYDAKQVIVQIIDTGHPFEPEVPPEPDYEAVAAGTSGGYGIYFIHQLMDSVTYVSTQDGNILTLKKRLGSNKT